MEMSETVQGMYITFLVGVLKMSLAHWASAATCLGNSSLRGCGEAKADGSPAPLISPE